MYPTITFKYVENTVLHCTTHTELLVRILDNILSNAAKYNKTKGLVSITISKNSLKIPDTGKGIKNTNKVFERYYKEQTRGLGLGLPIVKKLTKELHIDLRLDSTVGVGTCVTLDFSRLLRG
jgi:two-component system OmpR family sensor kinase